MHARTLKRPFCGKAVKPDPAGGGCTADPARPPTLSLRADALTFEGCPPEEGWELFRHIHGRDGAGNV